MKTLDYGPLTLEETLAMLDGEDIDVHRDEQKERMKTWEIAEQYIGAPPMRWPKLEFNWDLSPEGQRFALDGVNGATFQKNYQVGFRLGWIRLADFDRKLCHHNRRDGLDELWALGDHSKLARAIAHIARGLPMTPPLIAPLGDKNEICLRGGNHRYTVAKYGRLEMLPVYAEPRDTHMLSAIIPVRWEL